MSLSQYESWGFSGTCKVMSQRKEVSETCPDRNNTEEVENERFPCNVDSSTSYPVTSRA